MKRIVGIAADVCFTQGKRLEREKWLEPLLGDGYKAEVVSIDKGPAYLESSFDQALAGRGLLEAGVRAQQSGASAVVLLCMSDPAIDALRERLDIPVVGAAQASLFTALSLADRLSVLTILPAAIPVIERLARVLSLDRSAIASIRSIDMLISEMDAKREAVIDALVAEGERALQQDGAQALVLGCTEMGPTAAAELQERLGCPVVDPNLAAFLWARNLVDGQWAPSRLAYPATNLSIADRLTDRSSTSIRPCPLQSSAEGLRRSTP